MATPSSETPSTMPSTPLELPTPPTTSSAVKPQSLVRRPKPAGGLPANRRLKTQGTTRTSSGPRPLTPSSLAGSSVSSSRSSSTYPSPLATHGEGGLHDDIETVPRSELDLDVDSDAESTLSLPLASPTAGRSRPVAAAPGPIVPRRPRPARPVDSSSVLSRTPPAKRPLVPSSQAVTAAAAAAGPVTKAGAGSGGSSKGLTVQMNLNLEVEIELKAHIHGDITLSLL